MTGKISSPRQWLRHIGATERQQGVALLVVMMALLAGSAVVLMQSEPARAKSARLESLLSAKEALIAYAVNYADNYGHNTRGGTGRLPCPSQSRSGTPSVSCGINTIGYLPSVWMRQGRLMEIDYLERFLDQDIWYAVAGDHRFNPAFNPLNSYRGNNLLSVDSQSEVVAVLISPGKPLEGQARGGAALPAVSVSEYLEGENSDADTAYTLTGQNDLVLTIRRDELIPLMERRVLGFVKEWLIEYKSINGFYPYAAAIGGNGECQQGLTRGALAAGAGNCLENSMADTRFSNLPSGRALRQTWFYRHQWPALIHYIVDETCAPPRGLADCDGVDDPARTLMVNGEGVEVVLISTGAAIATTPAGGLQMRESAMLHNYLDSESLLSGDLQFELPLPNTDSNDQLVYLN